VMITAAPGSGAQNVGDRLEHAGARQQVAPPPAGIAGRPGPWMHEHGDPAVVGSGPNSAGRGRATGVERDRDELLAFDQARWVNAEAAQVSDDAGVVVVKRDRAADLVVKNCMLGQ